MEYLSSGALSREHYALVNKVEEAASQQQADAHLLEYVEVVRRRLARRQNLSSVRTLSWAHRKLICHPRRANAQNASYYFCTA